MNQKYLDPLIHILKIRSVSTQKEYLTDMKEARHYLLDLFSSLGFETKLLKSKRHDAVFAQRIESKKLPTVLIYGHYDVQPPEPLEEWKSDPFNPVIKNNVIYGRGTTDNKAQFMIHVMAVKKFLEAGKKLPANFKFVIEGEEEIGSVSVSDLAKKYAKNLFTCNYLLVSDSQMLEKGQPTINISLRGILYLEIFLQASDYDLHSGEFGGVAENPAIVLARIVNALKDGNNKIAIPAFYDDIITPTKKELNDYKKLDQTAKRIMAEGGSFLIGGGETKPSLAERRFSRPTLDINGLTSGYQGEGSKTIIPAKASAKISMRLVPYQTPDKTYKLFVDYVKELLPKGIKLTILRHADALPYKAPTDNPVFDLVKKSLAKYFGKAPLFSGVGGSIGFVPIMADALKVPCLMIGFGLPGENLHAPNEHFSLENYFSGIDSMAFFYRNLPASLKRESEPI